MPRSSPSSSSAQTPLALSNSVINSTARVLLPAITLLLLSSSFLSRTVVDAEPLIKNTHTVYGGGCPAGCSGHGQCVGQKQDGNVNKIGHECKCHDGFTGTTCSLRICPSGRSWADPASAVQTAHADGVECSRFGFCDRATGKCACRDGFEGNACQRLKCPMGDNNFLVSEKCSGHGACMTMAQAAKEINYDMDLFTSVTYTNWDADMIQGCVCHSGWTGHDCSQRECPWGPDPRITSAKDEVQVVDCKCQDVCTGWIHLGYKGDNTRSIPFDSSAAFVEHELNRLDSIEDVRVSMPANKACTHDGSAIKIEFLRDVSRQRDYQNITVNITYLSSTGAAPSASVHTNGIASAYYPDVKSQKSTKVPMECSGRGTCNARGINSGECSCYPGYGPASDGRRNAATRRNNYLDCGSVRTDFNWTGITCPKVAPQYGGAADICGNPSAHTACNPNTLACQCDTGYEGGACEWLSCSRGKAWFDIAKSASLAHQLAPCSNVGKCSRTSGTCQCDALFEGNVCSTMMCAKNDSYVCGDKGVCMTMNKLATYSTTDGEYNGATYTLSDTTWDANKIQGCYCRKSMSGNSYQWDKDQLGNDGLLDQVAFNTYRGYYGFTHTDYAGYDCSKMECPRGDDHLTPGINEIQRVRCSATAGGFSLTFRENTTELINWNDPAPIVEQKLEKIFTIGNVSVTYTNQTAVPLSGGHGSAKGLCNTTYADIEFLTELGDLPLMKVTGSTLVKKIGMSDLASVPKINVTESVKGTKENIECSGHGYCNPDIGMCICDVGYTSSDGQGGLGHRGDCGFHYTETQVFLPMDELEE
ncbi:hypothetical protein TrST_g6758 [Triparma strigata]|uniref:EGF-like domain-containing protein n=1 Tax=Triparma strigata TaxID=1606541 RepID=A0A9W7BVB9_9STRA|nr:hypothetical protein TrST_g6758 [Triparma strigata]